jgi:hypothetical protein
MVAIPPWMVTAVGWLKAPISRVRRWRADRELLATHLRRDAEYERYVSQHGAVVWRSKTDPAVYLCPKCFEDGHHYALQSVAGARDTRHRCPSCHALYQVVAPYQSPPNPPRTPGGRNNWMRNW